MKTSASSEILEIALDTWNTRFSEMISLITTSPSEFMDGQIYEKVKGVEEALCAVSYSLLTLFFLIGVFSVTVSFESLKRPESALRLFVRFSCAKVLIDKGGEILNAVTAIAALIVKAAVGTFSDAAFDAASLPEEVLEAASGATFLQSIPLFAVSLIAALMVFTLAIKMTLTVYGRFFKIYLYQAASPLAFSALGGETTAVFAKNFIRSYASVCLEGLMIALCLIIFSFFASSAPAAAEGKSAVSVVWRYMGNLIFNMLILNFMIESSDKVVREMIY